MHPHRIASLRHKPHCFALRFQTSEVTLKCSAKCLALNNVPLFSPSSLLSHLFLFRWLCDILPSDSLTNIGIYRSYFPIPLVALPGRFYCPVLFMTSKSVSPLQSSPVSSSAVGLNVHWSFPLKCPTGTYNENYPELGLSPTRYKSTFSLLLLLLVKDTIKHSVVEVGKEGLLYVFFRSFVFLITACCLNSMYSI